MDFPLLPPDATIPFEGNAISITGALILRVLFAQDDRAEAQGVAALLDAVVSLLGVAGQRH